MNYTVEVVVKASLEQVWQAWTSPADIIQWNFASNDWHCPSAEIELKVGSTFSYRMEAKDQSFGFDFEGKFIAIEDKALIEYELGDKRKVQILFSKTDQGIKVIERFDAENENSGEQQRQGWQAILNNFKKHVEAK